MRDLRITTHRQGAGDQIEDRRLAQLHAAAARFRQAIERCDPAHLTICMQRFPAGSCGDAAPLLGTYLAEQRLGTFMYVLGERDHDNVNGRHSHAWLEDDGLIIDITADQFPEINEKVIVTHRSDWHATFERPDTPHPADYRIYDPRTVASLAGAYGAILAELKRIGKPHA
jgi:hypothetical protein